MAEFVVSESDFWKFKNALVSGSIHIGSPADLQTIAKLFVRTGSTRLATSSDVWQYQIESIDRVDRFSVELSRFVRLDRFQGL